MRVRLRAKPTATKPRVDRNGDGRINGLSLITKGEALGHGFWIDDKSVDQVVALATNAKGRWTHGNLCADGLGTHLGKWENLRRDGGSAVGDFVFSPTAKHVRPEGLSVDAPSYLLDLAEREPDAAGVSTVLHLDDFELEALSEEQKRSGEEPRRFARIQAVPRGDFVADPAANPAGLFAGTPSELSERASSALDEAAEIYGEERVRGFLASYLNGKATTASLSAKGGTMTLEEAQAQLAQKDAELATLKGRLDTIEAQAKAHAEELAAAKKAEADRLKKADADYLEQIKAKAVELQAPIDAADLARVKAHFDAGRREVAHEVGDLLLRSAHERGGKAFTRTEAPPKTEASEHEAGAKRGLERLRARRGSHQKTKQGR